MRTRKSSVHWHRNHGSYQADGAQIHGRQGPPQAARHQGGSQVRPHHGRREEAPPLQARYRRSPRNQVRETDITVFFPAAAEQGTPRSARARPDIRECASRGHVLGWLRHAREGDDALDGRSRRSRRVLRPGHSLWFRRFSACLETPVWKLGCFLGFVSRARSSVCTSLTLPSRAPFNATGSTRSPPSCSSASSPSSASSARSLRTSR